MSRWILTLFVFLSSSVAHSANGDCCAGMGGINYCDSSAGRFVCCNGYYSSCYCDRHAVMDLQKFQGCCMWQGGVMVIDPMGLVVCNNGAPSEICSWQGPKGVTVY